MNQSIDSDKLRLIKLKRLIHEIAGGNKSKFSLLTGIAQGQISQMSNGTKKITDKTWAQITTRLQIEDTAKEQDFKNLRIMAELEASSKHVHQGEQFKKFLEHRKIKSKDVAVLLGVSEPMISTYKSTSQFRPDVARKINGLMYSYSEQIQSNVVSNFTVPHLNESSQNINLKTTAVYTFNTVPDYPIDQAIVLKIETDGMEPTLSKDSNFLAIFVLPNKYKYHTGLTIVQYADMISVGEVVSNDLFDKGYIALNRAKGSVIKIAKEDIQNIWKIVEGLNVKLR